MPNYFCGHHHPEPAFWAAEERDGYFETILEDGCVIRQDHESSLGGEMELHAFRSLFGRMTADLADGEIEFTDGGFYVRGRPSVRATAVTP